MSICIQPPVHDNTHSVAFGQLPATTEQWEYPWRAPGRSTAVDWMQTSQYRGTYTKPELTLVSNSVTCIQFRPSSRIVGERSLYGK